MIGYQDILDIPSVMTGSGRFNAMQADLASAQPGMAVTAMVIG